MKRCARKYLIIGFIGALITVVGEVLGGYAPSSDTTDKMTALFSSIEAMSVWQIGLGSTIGALGILMQLCGVYGLYLTFDSVHTRSARVYRAGMYGYSVIGAIVHVLMAMLSYVYMMSGADMAVTMDFTLWFALPITLIFFALYIPFSISMFIQLWKGRTPFPRWVALFNPLIGKAVVSGVCELLPRSAATNALSYANMGVTAVIIFTALLIALGGDKEKADEAQEA